MLPTDKTKRKECPISSGVLDYFPLAIAEIARVSFAGNEQHNKGEPLHWAREKSTDHADCLMRHFMERGTKDTDGMRHLAKAAWRVLAMLQLELEKAEQRKLRSKHIVMYPPGQDEKAAEIVAYMKAHPDALAPLPEGFSILELGDEG